MSRALRVLPDCLWRLAWLVSLAPFLALAPLPGQDDADGVRRAVERILAPLVDDTGVFALTIEGHADGVVDLTAPRVEAKDLQRARFRLRLQRTGVSTFVLTVRSPWADFELRRGDEQTVLVLPGHAVAFRGKGATKGSDSLAPEGFLARLLGRQESTLRLARSYVLSQMRAGGDIRVRRLAGDEPGVAIRFTKTIAGLRTATLRLESKPRTPATWATADTRYHDVDRTMLERMVLRATRRLLETYVPVLQPIVKRRARKIDHGELRFGRGQRVALLHGTPRQIGRAHADLLGPLVRQTVDSCLYLVGMVETIRTGKWFPEVLGDAWRRLSPHIPKRHKDELDALADAMPGLSREEVRLANVFPEYFHCSGFAVFGRATKGGKLYHGRVLDYMTMIGLQHAAVTFVIQPDQGYAFLSVGYAGFIGSVTGMNERQISLGEMGGRGRFLWDGVPMATLMRRALEECNTLDDVQSLWRRSPRTCEYFYVFADGKHRRAVGVSATPDKIEFVAPGETHDRLGPGIQDVVVLSAGGRLKELRRRIRDGHGSIDAAAAIRLMDRPVAMQSNLHSVLMVPEDGIAWIAHASQDRPAVQTRYVSHSLPELLLTLPSARMLRVRDTKPDLRDEDEGAAAFLKELAAAPSVFTVRMRPRSEAESGTWHSLVTFPSPGHKTDDVVLEWYRAKDRAATGAVPAVLILHILDGRMRIARGVAKIFANRGYHAFVMHMAGYGRRGPGRKDYRTFFSRTQQSVRDALRAHDAIAALPGIDPDAIGIQGTSLGGFTAAIASAFDGRFHRTFLVLTGGDLPTMFANGARDTAKIKQRLHEIGIRGRVLEARLRSIDPVRLAHRLPADRTWMYSAKSDSVVPAANARALGRAAGLDDDHHLWFTGDHYTCALHLPAILAHMVAQMR